MFIPKVNEQLVIGSESYYFTAHPAAKDMPYGQTGRKATVFQLKGRDGKKRALKVFSSAYRSAENLYKTNELLKYSAFPGLATCERFVISRHQFPTLIQQKRDLDYSVLMPWIEGKTWQDVVLNKQLLKKDDCLQNAMELNRVLATMEVSNVAHCDLSGPNIILRPAGISDAEEDPLSLIDLEEMYAPDLTKPKVLPAGSAGYAHSTASKGLWSPYADRFAGSILLANMLAWSDAAVVNASYGENYFSPQEMHTNSSRYQKLVSSLESTWGKVPSELFSAAWYSKSLQECPSFSDWAREFNLNIERVELPLQEARPAQPQQAPQQPPKPTMPSQSSWQASRHGTTASRPNVVSYNSRSPISGFKPLYSPNPSVQPVIPPTPPVQQPKQSTPLYQQNRTDFTEMNRLADWIEEAAPNNMEAQVGQAPSSKQKKSGPLQWSDVSQYLPWVLAVLIILAIILIDYL